MIELLAGFGAGLSLIVAIGAQNAYVLRAGLAKSHVGFVVAICAVSDALLIAAGIAGFGQLIRAVPIVIEVARWFGVAYLLWFAYRSFRASLQNHALAANAAGSIKLRSAIVTTLSLTYLNPHVYLDTVILLGSIASQYETSKWLFGVGAMLGSIIWFSTLGFGARFAARFTANPKFWRYFDRIVAIVMVLIAISIATMSVD